MSTRDILLGIRETHGDLTPQIVLDEARDPEHPLHHRFTWDDNEAAEQWRLHQAQRLIQKVNVRVTPVHRRPITVRAFVSKAALGGVVGDEEPVAGSYLPVEEVIANDVTRTAWFRSLEREWKALCRKAAGSREFADMVLADLRDEAS